MEVKKYLRRHVYRWHRITSLLVAVPILLWTISGFLHPVMNRLKPDVRNSALPVAVIDSGKIRVSLYDALAQHKNPTFRQARVVKLYKGFYYQVAQPGIDSLTYFNCESGNILRDGDRLYAGYLAQRYLMEDNGPAQKGNDHHQHEGIISRTSLTGSDASPLIERPVKARSKIIANKLLTSFTKVYKKSNRLLPVYEVAFDRADSIRLYIETGADRLALATDYNKRWFTTFFSFAHSWSFLDSWGKGKSVLLGSFSALCFLSCLLGFVVYHVMNKQKRTSDKNKRWHRWLGNVFLLTTLLYAFSGAWHAFAKLPQKPQAKTTATATWQTEELRKSIAVQTLFSGTKTITSLALAKIHGQRFWRVTGQKEKEPRYASLLTGEVLPNGDAVYATALACRWKGADTTSVAQTKRLTAFNHRYSMMNKRLPVVEVAFNDGTNYYVETTTGSLAAISRPGESAERFSFSNLHMHHYWEIWLGKGFGKTVKNGVLLATTLGLLLLALTGSLIYINKRKRKTT